MSCWPDAFLLSLPADLVGTVVCQWLGLKELVALDSAYCKDSLRNKWRKTLSDNASCIILVEPENIVAYRTYKAVNDFVRWIGQRQLRARKFVIADETNVLLSAIYLDNYGPFVTQLRLFILDNFLKCDITSTCTLISYCMNLHTLIVEDCRVPKELIELLPTLPQLKELHLHCADDADNHDHELCLDAMVQLNVLQLTCVTLCCHVHTALKILKLCSLPLIHKLSVHYKDAYSRYDKEADTMKQKIMQCHNLQTLSLRFHILDEDMQNILLHCAYLERLSLTYCYGVTDASAVLASKMPRLHTLCIDNTGFFDGLMEALAEHTKHTLHTLCVNSEYITHEGLNTMLQGCTQLRTLRLFVTDDLPIDAQYMQNLTTLSVNARFTLVENVLNIAKHCHALQHLVIAVDNIGPNERCFSLWQEQQIPHLRTLSLFGSRYYSSDVIMSELNILQEHRPKLLILRPEDDMQYALEKKFAYGMV